MTLYKCPGPGPADTLNGVETIVLDEDYYLFQVYSGFLVDETIEKGEFVTKEGYRVKFKVLDTPNFLRNIRVRIESIEEE